MCESDNGTVSAQNAEPPSTAIAPHCIVPISRTVASNKTRSRLLNRLLATLSPQPPQTQEQQLVSTSNALVNLLGAAAAAATAAQALSPKTRRQPETQAKVQIFGRILGSASAAKGKGNGKRSSLPPLSVNVNAEQPRPKGLGVLFGEEEEAVAAGFLS